MAKKVGSLRTYLIIGALVVIFLPPFAKYQELRAKNKRLENELVSLREESKRLEWEKMRLETDINYVEKKAREKIGIVKKGEIVLKSTPPKK